jgi:hypothetical protein
VGKGKSNSTIYYEYYISMHFGWCHGPIDQLMQVYFQEKAALDAGQEMSGPGSLKIKKTDLFGGFEREGGIIGTIDWRPGTMDQMQSDEMAQRYGYAKENMPGYRGLANLAFHGDSNSDQDGGSVGTNNPQVPSMWARLRRSSKTLGVNTAIIPSPDGVWYNSNPATMLHEILFDGQWGMGADNDDIEIPSFTGSAQTLFDEKFGMSLAWTKQTTIEALCQEILDHINGMMFFNPYTAKMNLKLIRNDYDRATLPSMGPDNAVLKSFQRKLWGETVNEIIVTWTDPTDGTEADTTITYQDPGNIAMQGTVSSETRNYYGIRDETLAANTCMRDLQSSSAPLATISLECLRTNWKHLDGTPIMPGDCIKFVWPEYGIVQTILRVLEIDWGTVDSSKLTVNLIEDIFSFDLAQFALPGGPVWTDPAADPNGTGYLQLKAKFFSAPYTQLQQDLGEDAEDALIDSNYPRIVIGCMVTPDKPIYADGVLVSGQADLQSFIMNTPTVNTLGDPDWLSQGDKSLTAKATLFTSLVPEVRSTLQFKDKYGGEGPQVGRYAIIGNQTSDEFNEEWIMWESQIDDTTWFVRRGVLDTVPANWSGGSIIWFLGESWDAYDRSDTLADVEEEYALQARTSKGIQDFANATHFTTVRPDRPYRPYRPANVKLDGVSFQKTPSTTTLFDYGLLDYSQKIDWGLDTDDQNEPRAPHWTINCSWANRNRKMEENVVLAWDQGDVSPEDGQTTEIWIYAKKDATGSYGRHPEDDTPLDKVVGLTGTSFTLDIVAYTSQLLNMSLRFMSRRGDFVSLQGAPVNLSLYVKGYGSDWDYLYGGWPADAVLHEFEGDIVLPYLGN